MIFAQHMSHPLTAETPLPPSPSVDQKIQYEKLQQFRLCQSIRGEGIFMGLVQISYYQESATRNDPKAKIFVVFAAPNDLTDCFGENILESYRKASTRISLLKGWHGHDGSTYINHRAFYRDLLLGHAEGKWVLAPRIFVDGTNDKGQKVRSKNMYDLRNVGDFRATFQKDDIETYKLPGHSGHTSIPGYPAQYLTGSSRTNKRNASTAWVVNFSNGKGRFRDNNELALTRARYNCRPIRLVELIR